MGEQPIKFVSVKTASDLHANIESNLERYVSGDFTDLAKELGWALETQDASYDPDFASLLDPAGGKDSEIKNSLIVFRALKGMTPALARDERIWVRLSHIEGLTYARARWIGTKDPVGNVKIHFFASGLPQCRDDNALGRLWWNGYLANILGPEDPEQVLEQMLARANIRLQFVDRANASFRIPLARGLIRLLRDEPWLNSHDRAFEDYIRVLDRDGGGRLFEAQTDGEVDAFLRRSLPLAQSAHASRPGS
tara:strand:- start:183 stop:935 length:753 start_codon:yes stop_codon:yes gene_type:complete